MIGSALEKAYSPCVHCEYLGEKCESCMLTLGKKVVEDLSDKLDTSRKEMKELKYQLEESDKAYEEDCKSHKEYMEKEAKLFNETLKHKQLQILNKIITVAHRNCWKDDNILVCDVSAIDDIVRRLKEEIDNECTVL
jgi:hypothetical protein